MTVLATVIVLGVLIFVHELGHFLAAKTFGVRCDKFYVGFDVPISIGPIKAVCNCSIICRDTAKICP